MADSRLDDLRQHWTGLFDTALDRHETAEQDLAALQVAALRGITLWTESGVVGPEADAAWEANLLHAEATLRQLWPAPYRAMSWNLTVPSTMPWTRSTLEGLTPRLLALNWNRTPDVEPVPDVAEALARNERIADLLWRGSGSGQELAAELLSAFTARPSTLRLAGQVLALGVTRLTAEGSEEPSLAHGKEVRPSSVERMDLTALEAKLVALVQEPGVDEVDVGTLIRLDSRAAQERRNGHPGAEKAPAHRLLGLIRRLRRAK